MDELKRLQEQAAQLEAIACLSRLASATFMGIAALFNGVMALITGIIGGCGIVLMSLPVIFFCLLFVALAVLIL